MLKHLMIYILCQFHIASLNIDQSYEYYTISNLDAGFTRSKRVGCVYSNPNTFILFWNCGV